MYLQMLSSNTTLQCGRRADCPTDNSVTLSSGTKRTSSKQPFFCSPLTLNRRRSIPFLVAKISESSPRLIRMGFESILNDSESNNSSLCDMWFNALESGWATKMSSAAVFPWQERMRWLDAFNDLSVFSELAWDRLAWWCFFCGR